MRALTGFVLTGYLRSIGDIVLLVAIPLQVFVLAHIALSIDVDGALRVAVWAGVVLLSTFSIGVAYFVASTLSRFESSMLDKIEQDRRNAVIA